MRSPLQKQGALSLATNSGVRDLVYYHDIRDGVDTALPSSDETAIQWIIFPW